MTKEKNVLLKVSGRFRELFQVPGVRDFGRWQLKTWENHGSEQHGAVLVSERAPWRDLFEALDDKGHAESSAPVSAVDEADAIFACCWRYGSYAHVLTGGELYPPFRTNPELSRISDSEMMRINLEFSSGLAAWWSERVIDPEKIYRRVRAALRLLPMPWRKAPQEWELEFTNRGAQKFVDLARATITEEADSKIAHLPDWERVRREANAVVNEYYRNGDIENFHAGEWSQGPAIPGFVRLYQNEIERIGRKTVRYVSFILAARELFQPGDRAKHLFALFSPHNWSLTEETASVEFYGMPATERLDFRLRALAERAPQVYRSLNFPD